MASISKYAGLPDIDSAPDVYETADVPLEHSNAYDSDSDLDLPRASSPSSARRTAPHGHTPGHENIDATRLDTSEARKKFGGASFSRNDGDSSRRATSRRLPSTSVYSIADPSDSSAKETNLERLRRLRSEVAELEEDVRREQTDTAASAPSTSAPTGETAEGSKGKGKKREVSPAVLLQQLQLLRGDLGGLKLDGEGTSEEGVLEGEGEKEEGGLAEKAKSSKGLLEKLGLVGATEVGAGAGGVQGLSSGKPRVAGKDGELERRVAELEKLLGANEADIDETHPLPSPLLPTINRLDHLLTLLTQPRQIDSISRRVKVLVSDLERMHDSRRKIGDTRPINVALQGGLMTVVVPGAGGEKPSGAPQATTAIKGGAATDSLPPDAIQRVDALFTLLPRLDPLLPLTPRLLTRLRSLSTLHSSASSFAETLAEVKQEVSKLEEGEKGLSEVLEGLEKSVGENEGRMRGNLEGLESRLEGVVKRLDALNV